MVATCVRPPPGAAETDSLGQSVGHNYGGECMGFICSRKQRRLKTYLDIPLLSCIYSRLAWISVSYSLATKVEITKLSSSVWCSIHLLVLMVLLLSWYSRSLSLWLSPSGTGNCWQFWNRWCVAKKCFSSVHMILEVLFNNLPCFGLSLHDRSAINPVPIDQCVQRWHRCLCVVEANFNMP